MKKQLFKNNIPELNLLSKAPYTNVDCNLMMAIDHLKPAGILHKMGFKKRNGDGLAEILYTVFLLPLLQVKSIGFYFDNQLPNILKGKKDVIYDFMKNQSINWSLFTLKLALRFFNSKKWSQTTDTRSAFIVDDTLDKKYGSKMEATSLHWDHNKGTSIRGHQILQLGYANSHGFLPLLAHIFVGAKKRVGQSKEFKDQRNSVTKSYFDAHNLNKHQLLAKMLGRVIRFGFHAHYLLGDAWFGSKNNIKLALKHDLTAIFMIKRGKSKYRFQGKDYTAKQLYRKFKKQMIKLNQKSFHACAVTVEYDLSKDKNNPDWIEVQLVFSRMKSAPKSSWVVLLCTDTGMELQDILKTYALRWNIEVYFKEIKQYFGFMKEQSWQYTVCLASVHLAMIRYILFYYTSLISSSYSFAELRNQVSLKMMIFSYGLIAWQSIGQIISEILRSHSTTANKEIMEKIKCDIEKQVACYFENLFPIALGIVPDEIQKLDYSEKKGAL